MRQLAFILTLTLALAGCDKCKDVECENDGVCKKGICECTDRYYGESCHKQTTPSSISIERFRVSGLERWVNRKWDEGLLYDTLPDIFLLVRKGISTQAWHVSPEYFEDASVDAYDFSEGLPIVLDDAEKVIRLGVCDRDDQVLGTNEYEYQEVYWFTTSLYDPDNGFPEYKIFTTSDGGTLEVWYSLALD